MVKNNGSSNSEVHPLATESATEFDNIISLARIICQVPIAAVTFIEGEKLVLKAKSGLDIEEIPLSESLCSVTLEEKKIVVVEDTLNDARFRTFPMVNKTPHIRFYAGVPLIGANGTILGTLCIADSKPSTLTPEKREGLELLSTFVVTQIELKKTLLELHRSLGELKRLEEELLHQREEYKRIVDSATEIIYECDSEGRITFFNPTAVHTLGFSEAELLGRHYLDLVHPNYRLSVDRFYKLQVRRRSPVTYNEVPVRTKTGTTVWLGQNVSLREKEGVLEGFSVIARDITERKNIEIALREGQERYQIIVENAAEGIYMTDPDTKRIIDANPAFSRIIEYSLEELRGLSIYDLVVDVPENIDRRIDNLRRLRNPIRIERTYRTKSGKEVFVEAAVSVITLNGKETLVTIVHDVTKRKEAEAKLLASEQRFRELFTKIPLPSWVCDLETLRFLEVNEAAVIHYGYSREEFLRMRLPDIRPNAMMSQLQIAYELIQTRQSTKNVTQHRLKNGTIIDVESTWHEITFDGRKAILVVVRDITELKRAQEELEHSKRLAEQASKAKSEFLANMSHEIRTPMNGILATIELLYQTPLTEEQKGYLETIQVSGDALMKIINNILDFSRLEAGDIQPVQQEVNIQLLIEETFELFAIPAEQKGLELHYWIDDDVPSILLTDATRLRQILMNLLSNAVKFTEKGGVLVTVARGVTKTESMNVLFSVRDTGPGIPKERIDRVFQPFTQVDSSLTRKHGGLGLGLSICARSVELLGGRIWIESVPDQGTTVRFDIRTGNSSAAPGAPSNVDIFKGHSIALVSDHEIQVQIVKRLLTSWGCTVDVLSTPQEVLNYVSKEHQCDCFVMNSALGDVGSLNLVKLIRQRQGWDRTKVLMLVPHGKYEYENGTHAVHFIRKPLRHHHLLKILEQCFTAPRVRLEEQKTMVENTEKKNVIPLKILVAEDNAINQKLILRILKALGYEGELAANGKEAVEKVLSGTYDIVFMDVQMPEIDGYEATRIIREKEPKEKRTVIVAMTAHALQGDRERCLEAGMDDYLSKPLLIDDVRKCIDKWRSQLRGDTP
ncbi:MAG: PAS domain S-box protein [Bacteroidetes bacterium]|nr:PAS domain S-box protein [Bacteroidota bacterium]